MARFVGDNGGEVFLESRAWKPSKSRAGDGLCTASSRAYDFVISSAPRPLRVSFPTQPPEVQRASSKPA